MQPDHEPFDLEAVPATEDAEENRKKLAREQYISDLRVTMQLRSGRRLLHAMLRSAGVFSGGFIENERAMYFKEGGRNTGLKLLNDMMEADNAAYIKMLTEED